MQDSPKPEYVDWNPPLPLEGAILQPWPAGVFPAPFDRFVHELSRSTETPIELSSMLTIAAVATASHTKYEVAIKEDYKEPVNIWIAAILPPASRKSKVHGEITSPLKAWEIEQKELMKPQIEEALSRRKTQELRIKELRNQASKASEPSFEELNEKISTLEGQLEDAPNYPQIWASDATTEHLGTIMSSNREAIALLSDEGGIFDILAGLYSDGRANIDLLLQGHSANSVRVDRVSRSSIFLERPVITMGLAIQPEVIKTICNNKKFRGRGLLGRFLYVFPKSNIGSRNFDEPAMDAEAKILYREAMKAILDRPLSSKLGKSSPQTLILTEGALNKWRDYAWTLERLMSEELGVLSHITDWAGKLAGAIARLAALLHIMRYWSGMPENHPISLDDMNSAVKIGHVLNGHALKVFNAIQESDELPMARMIQSWLIEKRLPTFTLREANRKFRQFKKGFREPILELLSEREIIREVSCHPKQMKGRKSDIYEVNPLLFKD